MPQTPSPNFEDVISAWTDTFRCRQKTHLGHGCQRPARWLLNIHGCQRIVLCGHHLNQWRRPTLRDLQHSAVVCSLCGRTFYRFDDAATVAAI